MKFPDNEATRLTDEVMAALHHADVLKPDEPNHPANYNRAYSSVHAALTEAIGLNPYSSAPAPLLPIAMAGLPRLVGKSRGKPASYYKERMQ
jgi:hypothetical protein